MNEEKSSFIKGINEQRPTAYHQLYNEYYKALVLYAINFLSSQQAAEDIVQDLFATMWEKKMRFFFGQRLTILKPAELIFIILYEMPLLII